MYILVLICTDNKLKMYDAPFIHKFKTHYNGTLGTIEGFFLQFLYYVGLIYNSWLRVVWLIQFVIKRSQSLKDIFGWLRTSTLHTLLVGTNFLIILILNEASGCLKSSTIVKYGMMYLTGTLCFTVFWWWFIYRN